MHLADLIRGPTSYRVFLLPDALQFDLSMTPAAQFRPAGPRFRLLFGETAAGEAPTPPVPGDIFIPTPSVALLPAQASGYDDLSAETLTAPRRASPTSDPPRLHGAVA